MLLLRSIDSGMRRLGHMHRYWTEAATAPARRDRRLQQAKPRGSLGIEPRGSLGIAKRGRVVGWEASGCTKPTRAQAATGRFKPVAGDGWSRPQHDMTGAHALGFTPWSRRPFG